MLLLLTLRVFFRGKRCQTTRIWDDKEISMQLMHYVDLVFATYMYMLGGSGQIFGGDSPNSL